MLALAIVFAVPLCAIEVEHQCERAHLQCMERSVAMSKTQEKQQAAELFTGCLPNLHQCLAQCSGKR